MSKIIIDGLTKVFGNNPAKALQMLEQGFSKDEILQKTGQAVGLNNVSFTIEAGETFVVMGLSGSGKSTLIRCINRLIEPTRGKVFVDGAEVTAMNEQELREFRRHKQAMVFQQFALFPHRTVLENAAFGLEIQDVGRPERFERAREALALVGLTGWEESYPHQLTGGCIAGGRRYFHVNARGDVEPCAFVHFAVDTIFGKSLVEILQNPIFKAYQKRLPFSDNLLRPCPLIDVPEALREIVDESGAKETHPGAAAILEGEHARTMDRVAANWKQRADRIWEADTAKSQLVAES